MCYLWSRYKLAPPPQVSSLPAHAGAAAVRTLQEGAGQRSVRQVHRRAAAAALAALLQETHAAAAGARRAAAAAAAAAAARERRRQVTDTSDPRSKEVGGPERDRVDLRTQPEAAAVSELTLNFILKFLEQETELVTLFYPCLV